MPAKILLRVTTVVIALMIAPITLGLSVILFMMGGVVSVGALVFSALAGGLFGLLEPRAHADSWPLLASGSSDAVKVRAATRHAA